MKKFLVSVADVYGYDSNDTLLFVGKTLLDSSIETTLSNTDVRGGRGNQLQYIYYHTAEMNITVNETQFSLEFLALNTGTNIQMGADMFVEESVTLEGGQGTVTTGTPLALTTGVLYGWVTKADGTVVRVTFTGSNFNIGDPNNNETVCVRYYTKVNSARQITINADMLPSSIRLVMEAQLCSSDSTTNQIGVVQIIVPKASMTGQFTLSMTADGVSQTPLTIRALASTQDVGGCTGGQSVYAYIIERLFNTNWYDNVIALAFEGGDFTLAANATKTLTVYAIPGDGSAAFIAPAADITIASSTQDHATVAGNVVTGVAAGTSTISATINDKPEIDANIIVTVE